MRALVLGLALLLAGCQSRLSDAEARYDIVSGNGTYAEKCEAATDAKAAALSAQDEAQYEHWRLQVTADCGLDHEGFTR